MCVSTVRTDSTSRSAISAFVSPLAASSTSWLSRAVSAIAAESSPSMRGTSAPWPGRVQLARPGRRPAGRVLPAGRDERRRGVDRRLHRVAAGAERSHPLGDRRAARRRRGSRAPRRARVHAGQPRVAALAQRAEPLGRGRRRARPPAAPRRPAARRRRASSSSASAEARKERRAPVRSPRARRAQPSARAMNDVWLNSGWLPASVSSSSACASSAASASPPKCSAADAQRPHVQQVAERVRALEVALRLGEPAPRVAVAAARGTPCSRAPARRGRRLRCRARARPRGASRAM